MQKDIYNIIRAEKLSRMLAQNTRSVLSSAVLGFLLLYTQAQQASIPLHHIYIWSAILLVISIARVAVGRYYEQHPTIVGEQIEFRLNVLRAGVMVTAACWGANVYLAGNKQSIELLFFCSFIISGISSGAVVSYAIDKISAMAYLVFAVAPLLIYLFGLHTQMTFVMSLAGVVYVFFMYYSINVMNKYLIDNIVLRVEAEQRDEQIKQMAFHDALTGLPNRRLLLDRLSHAIAIGRRNQTGGAVMFIDLDDFKKLNDTQGHDMGDMLLQQVAKRLKSSVRETDTVSRLGGDEFIIMLENLSANNEELWGQVGIISAKILADFNLPYMLKGKPYFVSPSIGVAMFGHHGTTHDDLLKNADAAMYQAKRAGRNTVRVFNLNEQ